MKTLLIITGPQGSGNHMWSKVFAGGKDVYGWQELLDTYWIPHDQEPFAEAWDDPTKLKNIEFENYAVTSISCPYVYKGVTTIPDYESFINSARELGYEVKIAIIGRDQNIIQHQQTRVRGAPSIDHFKHKLPQLLLQDLVFISTELLYLYGMNYLRILQSQLKFPISISQTQLDEVLAQDPNAKYIHPAQEQILDAYVRTVSGINNT